MGCSSHFSYRNLPPCANCGKEHSGFMGSTSWNHNEMCCSHACGIRLGKKLQNGMLGLRLSWEEERVLALRIQIKILRNRLRG